MSRSFRESYLGKCLAPYAYPRIDKRYKMHRSLRRKINKAVDEESLPIIPRQINHKYGRASWGRKWRFPNWDYVVIRRNGRKFLLRNKICSINTTLWGYKGWRMYQ